MRAGLTCDCDIDGAEIGGQWVSGTEKHRNIEHSSAAVPRYCGKQQVPAVSSVQYWQYYCNATGLCSIYQYLPAAMRRALVSWGLKVARSGRVLGGVQARGLSTGDQVAR